MIIRTHLLALLLLPFALADDSFSCQFSIGADKYDLKTLDGDKVVSRTRETPPTSWVDELRFNICSELKHKEGVADHDQCPAKTRACLTKTNKKSSESDRIIAAIPLATSSDIPPDHKVTTTPSGVSIILHGPAYPPSAGGQPQVLQSLNVTLLCVSSGETSEPKFIDYDGSMAIVEWKTSAGCATHSDDKDPGHGGGGGGDDHHDDDEDDHGSSGSSGGGGMGWFFFLFILAFAAYFGLGAYHNYNQYGATGWDLVPHRDFWREVPYMLRDLIVHVFQSFRESPSRGGYHSV